MSSEFWVEGKTVVSVYKKQGSYDSLQLNSLVIQLFAEHRKVLLNQLLNEDELWVRLNHSTGVSNLTICSVYLKKKF